MADDHISRDDFVMIEPDGRIILSESVMETYVVDTPGCKIWFNEGSGALGLRLLRGVEDPPYIIQRIPGEDGRVKGVLNAGDYPDKVGLCTNEPGRRYPIRYYKTYRMIEIRGDKTGPKRGPSGKDVLADFEGLEDF